MISVIINTKDRMVCLQKCLASLSLQRVKPFDVIVVDASTDWVPVEKMCVEAMKNSGILMRYFHTAAGNSFQRNFGISVLAQNVKYVCFFDDDVVLFEDTVEVLVRKLEQFSEIAAVQGVEVNTKDQNPIEWLLRAFFFISHYSNRWILLPSGENAPILRPARDMFVGSLRTGFCCVKRSVLFEFKFDEWFKGYAYLEDLDFFFRISRKYKLLHAPGARFIHNSLPLTRSVSAKVNEMYIVNKTYFLCKNLHLTFWRRGAFFWSLIGHLLLGLLKSFVKRDFGYLRGVCKGIPKALAIYSMRGGVENLGR